jgi:hypothetical protein
MMGLVVIVAIALAVLSFGVFVWLLMKRPPAEPAAPQPGGLGGAQQHGAIADTAKVIEAMKGLSDSFRRAGPMVMAIISCLLFMLIALFAAAMDRYLPKADDGTKKTAAVRLNTAPLACAVSGFDPGVHQLGDEGIAKLKQTPPSCVQDIEKSVCSGEAAFTVVVGHADKRELNQHPRRYYGSNLSLAYQRALEVEGAIVKGCKGANASGDPGGRIWTLASGSANVGEKVEQASLEADRGVEIRAYTIGLSQ